MQAVKQDEIMFAALITLGRARFQMLRNRVLRAGLRVKLGSAMLVLLGLLGAFFSYSFSLTMVTGLRSPEFTAALREAAESTPDLPTDPAVWLMALPSGLILATLALLAFNSFGSLLSSLYLAHDLELLLVAPLPMRTIFIAKFFDGLTPQYGWVLVLFWPAMAGYGHGMGYGPTFHLSAVVALLLAPLITAGLSALLLMLVVRIVPPTRARLLINLAGSLVGVSFFLLSQLTVFWAPQVARTENLGLLLLADQPFWPSAWAGRALVAAGEGEFATLLVYGGLFATTALTIFSSCLIIAEWLYYTGWSKLADRGQARPQRTTSRRPRTWLAPLLRTLIAPFPVQVQAIFTKEWCLLTRDLRNLQLLIFPGVMLILWSIQFFTILWGEQVPNTAGTRQSAGAFGVPLIFFSCLGIANALAHTALSREGRAFWIIRLAPLNPWQVLVPKLVLAYLPYPLITLPLLSLSVIFEAQGAVGALRALALILLLGLGLTSFALANGTIFARLDWQNPAQQLPWQSGLINAIFLPLYLGLTGGLVIVTTLFASSLGNLWLGLGLMAVGWLLALVITACIVMLSLFAAAASLERREL